MSVATVADIRAGIAHNLSVALTGVQVSAYILQNPTPPYAHVFPCGDAGDIEYDQAMGRGLDVMPFTVEVFTGSPSDQGAQIQLDHFLDPASGKSVKAALEADRTLGGIVDTLQVTRCAGYRPVIMPPRVDAILSAAWYLEVYAKGA